MDDVINIETWRIIKKQNYVYIFVVMGHNIEERIHTYKSIS